MRNSILLALSLTLGLQSSAQAMDIHGAVEAASRLLNRNNPTVTTTALAKISQQGVQASQVVTITEPSYDDEVVAESFRMFAREGRRLYDLVSLAGRSQSDMQVACAQVDKQLSNNQGLYTALTIRPTQITAKGVGLFENNADLLYIKSALNCP